MMSSMVAAATQRQGGCTLSKNAVVVQRPNMESELESLTSWVRSRWCWGCLEADVSVPALRGDFLQCTAEDMEKGFPEKS